MKIVKGFVCVAEMDNPRQQQLFGRAINLTQERGYEAFRVNGLVPFEALLEAVLARKKMRKNRNFYKVWIAEIEMEIAEDETDWAEPSFKKAGSWIVIIHGEGSCELVGRHVERISGWASAMPGTPLELNGLKTIKSWGAVEWTARDSHRQAQCPVQVATFRFKVALKD